MGVVRDVTVDNLVTAVGNIDTSSLAQDSTLQDVVTAIGNISGGNDPVTNTTVNSLCKDTTGQSIASAISGLGATLGSDKANISGDNIVSPTTFRNNIGLTTSTTELTSPASQIYGQFIKNHYGVVYLYLDIYNYMSTTANTIGYLPVGFRPYHRILADVIVVNGNDDSFKGYAHFAIQPTGEITLKMQGNYTYPFCTLDISFPISNT